KFKVIEKYKFLLLVTIALVLMGGSNVDQQEDYSDWLREVYSTKSSKDWPRAKLHNMVNDLTFEDIGILPDVKYPKDNPYNIAKEALGKTLFFDPRLSSSGKISCATCHDPKQGWTD
ncbi:MAG TPA: cytochrome-c peroxidase, partial [Saprospiraceae bacterium]|nr:cytochrome-c peroxidase [Saprospiraceae bacterium]